MGDIQISSFEGFRAGIAQLTQLHGQIATKRDAGQKVSAAAAEAGKGEGGAAPAYATTQTALGSCVDGCGTHVDAAAAAVGAAIADLTALVNGMQSVDEAGADAVTAV